MATANDVAAYIVKRLGRTTTMQLQKLLYYSQGWHLAWDGVPLFDDRIEAWANGPVVYSVFDRHRGRFVVDEWPHGDPDTLTDSERETVDAILDGYGSFDARELVYRTHQEPPWRNARGDLPETARSNAEISLDDMAEYFSALDSRQPIGE